jgi:hypothetical protein
MIKRRAFPLVHPAASWVNKAVRNADEVSWRPRSTYGEDQLLREPAGEFDHDAEVEGFFAVVGG